MVPLEQAYENKFNVTKQDIQRDTKYALFPRRSFKVLNFTVQEFSNDHPSSFV